MAAYEFVQTLLEYTHVQLPGDPDSFWQIVKWTIWLKLIEEPETLLGERERYLSNGNTC
jgi:hypothetical protein